MKYNTQTPFIASYLILRKRDKVAFVLRSNTGWMNGYYSLPAGKVETSESYKAAAVREGLEEAGITFKAAILKFMHVMHRHGNDSDWVDVYFSVENWEGEVFNAEPHMHGELAWLDPQNLPSNTIQSVRYALEQIEAGKIYSEYGWS